jgi:LAS superfamily LD-carboxypeptidase LdcB
MVFLILGLLGYFGYTKYQEKIINENRIKVLLNTDLKVEINEEYTLDMFIKEVVNGIVTNKDEKVDTSTLGEKEVELLIQTKDNNTEKYAFQIEVVDTKKPEIEAKKEVTSYIGKDIDLLDGVSVTDNSKEEIKAKVIGDYDINKAGEYKLKYEASDSSNNKGEYDFILNIVSDPNNRTFTTSKGYSGKVVNGVTYIDGVLIANKTYSLPSNYGSGLTAETKNAFNKMEAAFNSEKEEANRWLWIASGYRSYWDQKSIYNNYVSRDGQANADTYSARPGHSEHQTGLAFDLNSIDDSFSNTYEGKWVHDNCYRFGLILRYPKGKESITGYMHESWHMRYVGEELAKKLYNGGDWITLEEYYGIDSKYS